MKIVKILVQVHTAEFGWQRYEARCEPNVNDGWMTINLINGTLHVSMQKVNQYSVEYEEKE